MSSRTLDGLWYTHCGVPTALGIAAQLGWLEKHLGGLGVPIRSIRDSADQSVRDSHFDHHLKHSVRQGGSSPAIWARAQGRETRVIGLIWTDESQQILTLPATEIANVKDLRGRRLALPKHQGERFPRLDVRGAAALRGYVAALATEGLTLDDVELVPLTREGEGVDRSADRPAGRFGYSFGEEVLALLDGRVDAIFVKDSRGKAVQAFLNAVEVIDLGRHPDPAVRVNYGVPRPLTVDAALLQDHPKVALRLLELVVEAGVWARHHPKETVALVSRDVGMPEHFVELAHPGLHEKLHTDLPESWIRGFERYARFLFEHGFLGREVDVRAWIDPGPLAELKARQGRRQPATESSAPS